jgi:SulP family sulfate permease
MLKPKLFSTLKEYSWKLFRADLSAGVIVGIVALPLAIAFAIASGVGPERGLITAIVAGFIISAFGGSRVQIGGPTGAFVVIVYSIIEKHGIDGLIIATVLAGILLVIMGLARFGAVIKFIPYPVIVGFTSGIALIIFLSQIRDIFGLTMPGVPAEFFAKIEAYAEYFHTVNPMSLGVSLATIALILVWQRFIVKIPGSLVALIIMTFIVAIFKIPVETIGTRFGEVSQCLPKLSIPHFDFSMISSLISPAMTIALLAGIESLLSAVVADGMIGGKHRSNMELIAQGMANIFTPLLGGIPATGAIARTATNVHNGGRTPIAGIVHAIVLLFITLFLGKWVAYIPLSCLAGILCIVAYRMSEWRSFKMIMRAPRSDRIVLIVTFLLTVIIDMTVAIEIGMIMAAFLLIRRLSLVANMEVITNEFRDEEFADTADDIGRRFLPEGVDIFEIKGPFFFGVTSTFLEVIKNIKHKPRVRIIRMRYVHSIDATALNGLWQVAKESKKNGTTLVLSGVHPQVLHAIRNVGIESFLGSENVCTNIDQAIKRAREIVG